MLLQEFRDKYLDLLLQFLWRQWSAIGVAGSAERKDKWVIDPEALLLFSLTICRYDQRLFDEIVDWLDVNERFVNVNRLRSIQKEEKFNSFDIMKGIAFLLRQNKYGIKWKGIAEMAGSIEKENLFFLKSGEPLPVHGQKDEVFYNAGFIRNPICNRGMSCSFPKGKSTSLLFQLRGLMGINSRSEVLLYLLVNGKGTITEIADDTYYAWRSVQDVLLEMGLSGILSFDVAKKGRKYNLLGRSQWLEIFLKSPDEQLRWICWPPLFKVLELIWTKLNDAELTNTTPLEQATEIRVLMKDVLISKLRKSGIGGEFDYLEGVTGEEYLNCWMKKILRLLENELVNSGK